MDNKFTVHENNTIRLTIQAPKMSDWQARINGVTFRPFQYQEPNMFHRFMQRICFGIKWERVK